MKNTLAICALVIALLGVRTAFGQAAAYTDADAYEVYSVLLGPRSKGSEAGKLVIEIETADYPFYGDDKSTCLAPPAGEEAVYKPLIDSYREVNKKSWLLQPKFASSVSYQLVSADSISAIFAKKDADGWKEFYAKYPSSGGVISMSAVGFNADKTLAVVYMGRSCGIRCGGGSYHFLRKTDGKWSEFQWPGPSCSWAS